MGASERVMVNREKVRELAERHSLELDEAANNGEMSEHLITLRISRKVAEQRDELAILTSDMPDDNASEFISVYSEELTFLADEKQARADALNSRTDEVNARAESAGKVIGAIVLIVFLIFIFSIA